MTDDTPAAGRSAGAPAPGPPPPSVSFFLIALGRRAQDAVDQRLREHGLSYHHLSALGHLHRQPGLSYSELARRARVTVQSIQATVSHLERAGLVDRGGTTSRGRRADLRVTDGGAQVLAAAQAAIRGVDDDLLDGFSPAERNELEAALLRVFLTRPGPTAEATAAG